MEKHLNRRKKKKEQKVNDILETRENVSIKAMKYPSKMRKNPNKLEENMELTKENSGKSRESEKRTLDRRKKDVKNLMNLQLKKMSKKINHLVKDFDVYRSLA